MLHTEEPGVTATPDDTKRCSCCGEVKPVAEFVRNRSRPDGLEYSCKVCRRARKAADYAANPEKKRAKDAAYRAANLEKVRAKNAAYRAANPEKVRARKAAYYAANREKERARKVAYRAANAEKRRADQARRRSAKLRATPVWCDKAACDVVYLHADTASRLLGEDIHVDHVVPLKCKDASGLHVPANLTILDAKRNISKRNKLDMAQLAALDGLVLDQHGWMRPR